MNENCNQEQHDYFSIVPALSTIHPNFELKHMAPYVFYSLWFIKSHSWLFIFSNIVVVKKKIVCCRSDENAPSNTERWFPNLLGDRLRVRDAQKLHYIVVWDILQGITLIKVSLG